MSSCLSPGEENMATLEQKLTEWEDRLDGILADVRDHVSCHSDTERFGAVFTGMVPSSADAVREQFLAMLADVVAVLRTMPANR